VKEDALIQQLRDGDEAAREACYQAYRQRLYATACHFLGHQDPDAEDMVHDCFAQAFEKIGGFEGRSSLYTWLNRICVNLCFNRIRQRKRMVGMLHEDLEGLLGAGPQALEREEAALKAERLRKLARWLKDLNRHCAQLLKLRMVEGLGVFEIKEKLNLPFGTVAARLSRCQRALRDRAKREGGDV
jgi:RNA polymerase sigma-70 factor (ECF subfamily)